METLPVAMKVTVELEIDGRPLRLSAQVEGEGSAVQRAVAELSQAIAVVLAQATKSCAQTSNDAALLDAVSPMQTQATSAVTGAPPAAFSPGTAVSETPSPEAQTASPPSLTASAPVNSTIEASTTPPHVSAPSISTLSPAPWMQRNRSRINLSLGGVLLALAIFVPIIVPADQRREVLIMTILFGLTAALLLFTAWLPVRRRELTDEPNQSSMTREDKLTTEAKSNASTVSQKRFESMRMAVKRGDKTNKAARAGWGLALGVLFVFASLLGPFVLGAITADERFVIMLGFAPITVIGFFMIALFGRGLLGASSAWPASTRSSFPPSKGSQASTAKRAPVARVPQNFEYRAIVPALIVGMLVLMILVVALVIYATLASVAR